MEEKKHVGRPTNEEVASRKKKKVVKYSLITIVAVLLVGGIALFLNRDNIDFSSIMGASVFKRYNYVVNGYVHVIDKQTNVPVYYLKVNARNMVKLTSCKVSNSKYADCSVVEDELHIEAKKKGNITVKIYGKNIKGKTVSTTRRIKIGKDFTPPVCKISTSTKTVKAGSNITATVTCNENVTPMPNLTSNCNSGTCKFRLDFDYLNTVAKNGSSVDDIWYNINVKSVKKVNNKTYNITFNIPDTEYYHKNYYLVLNPETFKDSSNNINITTVKSNSFKITN